MPSKPLSLICKVTRSRTTKWCTCVQEASLTQNRGPMHEIQIHTFWCTHAQTNSINERGKSDVCMLYAGRCALWMFSKSLYCLGCCSAISQLRVYRHGENKLNSLLTLLFFPHPTLKWIALNKKKESKHQINVKERPGDGQLLYKLNNECTNNSVRNLDFPLWSS